MPLAVGHSREDITPPVGTYMMGYAGRENPCTGAHDALTADAVAVSDGSLTVLLTALDVCHLGLAETEELKRVIGEATGLAPEAVMVNTSHTHAGPVVAQWCATMFEADYFEDMCRKAASAAASAIEDLRPAHMRAGSAPLDIGCNRRQRTPGGEMVIGVDPEGPRLAEVTAWRLARDGAKDVVLFSAPVHGTTMGWENLQISSEWMGAAARGIEEALPGVSAVFLQGCAGDQNPYRDERTFERVAEHGRAAREAVLEALGSASGLQPLPLANCAGVIDLPCADGSTAPLPIHGLRLGEAVLVGLGGEAFVEYALFARERSSARSTLALGYTDGSIGYLPTAAALSEGGYEAAAHEYFAGGKPWSLGMESDIKERLTVMLGDLSGDSPG